MDDDVLHDNWMMMMMMLLIMAIDDGSKGF